MIKMYIVTTNTIDVVLTEEKAHGRRNMSRTIRAHHLNKRQIYLILYLVFGVKTLNTFKWC
jgi:hypothetical protein